MNSLYPAERITLPPGLRIEDGNIRPRWPADQAAWIWLPQREHERKSIARFSLDFDWAGNDPLQFQVTADQRFQLFLDGALVCCGPDRGDLLHWSVAAYRLDLQPGPHLLEAVVWWMPHEPRLMETQVENSSIPAWAEVAPMSQLTWRPGFLFAGLDQAAHLSTGKADWQCNDLGGAVECRRASLPGYHDTGPAFTFHLDRWNSRDNRVKARVLVPAIDKGNAYGVRREGWRLEDSGLPEQHRRIFQGGQVVFTSEGSAACWDGLIHDSTALTVPAHASVELLWDTRTYINGYLQAGFSPDSGAELECSWAEALYDAAPDEVITPDTLKGHRDAWKGKRYVGTTDVYKLRGGATTLPALNWRSGRFLRISIRTQDRALELTRLAILATSYPFHSTTVTHCDDEPLQKALGLCRTALAASAHDGWLDSPFYEQLAYVGDNAVCNLCAFILSQDGRLPRRTLELFNYSRATADGFVAERYPSAWPQASLTYAMLWPGMVRDFAFWRGPAAGVKPFLPGVRSLTEHLLSLLGPDGLLGPIPGWPFVDWVRAWPQGTPPGAREGGSSLVNLHLLRMLQQAAELEQHFGEPELHQRLIRLAATLSRGLIARFWDDRRGLLADDAPHASFSEHAQALGLLGGIFTAEQAARVVQHLEQPAGLHQATIYFTHYLIEALYQAGRGDAINRRLEFWRGLPGQGFVALPECPEPSRSDCHAWGAHPLFHFAATLAGIRPSSPGFATVTIAPCPGPLRRIETEIPHLAGTLQASLEFSGTRLAGRITLPGTVSGTLVWQGKTQPLRPGTQQVEAGDK